MYCRSLPPARTGNRASVETHQEPTTGLGVWLNGRAFAERTKGFNPQCRKNRVEVGGWGWGGCYECTELMAVNIRSEQADGGRDKDYCPSLQSDLLSTVTFEASVLKKC